MTGEASDEQKLQQRRAELLEQLRLLDPEALAGEEQGSFRTRSGAAVTGGEATRRTREQISHLESLIARLNRPTAI